MSRVTRIRPIRDDEERHFFSELGRRRRPEIHFEVTDDELLADLDPGRLTWRAAGCPRQEARQTRHRAQVARSRRSARAAPER